MSDTYDNRYANLTPKQCKREALLLMQEALNGSRTWEGVTDRLVALKRIATAVPCPADDCQVIWNETEVN